MKRKHLAILTAQSLSYGLIITFLFADAQFNLTGFLRDSGAPIALRSAYIAACLIGIVGATSLWLTWHYISKSNKVSDMLVLCAWTHRVKTKEGWVSLETFFTEQLGFAVSHGLSEEKCRELRAEVDREWKKFKSQPAEDAEEQEPAADGKRPMGMRPVDQGDSEPATLSDDAKPSIHSVRRSTSQAEDQSLRPRGQPLPAEEPSALRD